MRKPIWKGCAVLLGTTVAWLLANYSQELVAKLVGSSLNQPRLPFLGTVPWHSGDQYTHFFSSVVSLGPVLAVVIVTAGLVELAKSQLASRQTLAAYLHCLAFQVLVTWAAFSRGAWDWAFHFESLVLTRGTKETLVDFCGPRWPWLLFVPLGAFGIVTLAKWHWRWLFANSVNGDTETARRRRTRLLMSILSGISILAVLTPWIVGGLHRARPWWPSLVSVALVAFTTVALAKRYWERRPATSGVASSEAFRRTKARLWVPILLAGSWLLTALSLQIIKIWFPPGLTWPNLGNVAAIPWSEHAEPRSTTVVIMGVLAIALVALGLVELAKVVRVQAFDGSGYGWLLGFQVVLFADALLSSAPDWSSYFLSQALPGSLKVDLELLPSWPWVSFIALLANLALFLSRQRSGPYRPP